MTIDLTQLDAEAIRSLIAQSRTTLRNRRLIADAHLRKRDIPEFTDGELAEIRRAARRFGIRPATLADEMLALRAHPQVVPLRSRDGDEVGLTPLVRIHWEKFRWSGTGTALTGTGHLRFDLQHRGYNAEERAAPGEYVTLGPDGVPTFKRLYGPGFVRAWGQLPALPTPTALRIILSTAGHHDTPQEALLTWCIGALRAAFHEIEDSGALTQALLGHPLTPRTLADLLGPLLGRVRAGQDPKEVISRERPGDPDWCQRLLRACQLFLVGTNLIVPDLETDPSLAVSLPQVWERYIEQEHVTALKAGRLRAAVVQRFGFTDIEFRGEQAWVRAAETVPRESGKLDTFLRDTPNVLVTESCKVYVQGEYRCVVEGRSADLPHADQVVRRLLAVATRHRERISTLRNDLPILESLFADVAGATVWDLATDPAFVPTPQNKQEDPHESDAA